MNKNSILKGKKFLSITLFLLILLFCETTVNASNIQKNVTQESSFSVREINHNEIEVTKYNGNDTDLEIPEHISGKTVVSIGAYAFSNQSSLVSIVLPDTISNIGSMAFSGCSSLNKINAPKNLVSVGECIFQSTEYLGFIMRDKINEPLYFGDVLIDYIGDLKDESVVSVREGTKGIADYVFSECNSIKEVILPEGLQSIGVAAFRDCTSLEKVDIPNSVKSIRVCAFQGCSKLKDIKVSSEAVYFESRVFEGTAWFDSQEDGMVYIGNTLYCYKGRIPYETVPVLKADTTSIAGNAFSSKWLNAITIPQGVQYIGEEAFLSCPLYRIVLPDSIKKIGRGAFRCQTLKKIQMPANVGMWEENTIQPSSCFLQALFGQSCKTFLDIVACPNWTKLQSPGQPSL